MESKLYKLTVGLFLKNNTAAGMKAFQNSAKAAKEQTDKLTKSIENAKDMAARIGAIRNGVGGFDKAIAGQKKLNDLAAKQANAKILAATTEDAAARKSLQAQAKALGFVRGEVNARTQALGIVERVAAAEQRATNKRITDLARISSRMQSDAERQAKREQAANEKRLTDMARISARKQRDAEAEEQRQRRAAEALFQQQQRYAQRLADQRASRVEQELNGVLARRQASYEAGQSRNAVVGHIGYMGAVAGAAAIDGGLMSGLRGAADLETQMVTIRNATSANPAQLDAIREMAFKISDQTAMSGVDSARILSVAAKSGINNPNNLLALAPSIAKFADVQFLSRGVSFEDATKQAIKIAHQYGRYTSGNGKGGIDPILNGITKVSMMMPDGVDKYLTQAGYYMPVFKRLGVSDDQSMMAGAFLDRMGLGQGKGGTALYNFLMNQMGSLALTGHVQKGRQKALNGLGLLNSDGSSKYYKDGHFDVFGSLGAINTAINTRTKGLTGHKADVAKQQAIVDIQRALGIQGGRIGFLGTPEQVDQLNQMMIQFKQMPGVDEMQSRYLHTFNGEFQRMTSNFASFLKDIMWPWLSNLQSAFRWLGDAAHEAQVWAHHNREAAKALSGAMGGLGAVLSGLVLAKTIGLTAEMLGITAIFSRMGVIFAGVVPFLAQLGPLLLNIIARVNPWVALFVVLGTAIYWAATHSKELGRFIGDAVFNAQVGFKNLFDSISHWISSLPNLPKMIGGLPEKAGSIVKNIPGSIAGGLTTVGNAANSAEDNIYNAVSGLFNGGKKAASGYIKSVGGYANAEYRARVNAATRKHSGGHASTAHRKVSYVDQSQNVFHIHGGGDPKEVARQVAAVLRDQAQRSRGNHSPGPSLSSYQFA